MASVKPGKISADKASTPSVERGLSKASQKTNQSLQLDDTLFQLKNALDEWSDLSKNKKDSQVQQPSATSSDQNHGKLLVKTRKLLRSLNQQLDELSE